MLLALSDLPANDLLVNCRDSKQLISLTEEPVIKLPVDTLLKKILSEALDYQRESDINSLCISLGTICWKDSPATASPLFIVPLLWSWRKNQREFTFEESGTILLNPYVAYRINKEQPDFRLPEELTPENAHSVFSVFGAVSTESYLGNFHIDRFSIFRDLKGISESEGSPLLLQVHGEGKITSCEPEPLSHWFSPVDSAQHRTILQAEKNPVVIQGPPGTGKSQVLINLIGRGLIRSEKILALSEKKAALNVLEKKMQALGLDPFCFVVHAQTTSSDLLKKLSATWKLLEQYKPKSVTQPIFDLKLQFLQQIIDRLSSKNLLGGMNFHEYRQLLSQLPEAAVRMDVPGIESLNQHSDTIRHIYTQNRSLQSIRQFFFRWENPEGLVAEIRQLGTDLHINRIEEVKSLYASIHRCVLVENPFWEQAVQLVDKPQQLQRFKKLVLSRQQLIEQIDRTKSELAVWKEIPTSFELNSWKQAENLFTRWKIKRQIHKKLKSPVDVPALLPATEYYHDAQERLLDTNGKIRSFGFEPGAEALLALEYARALNNQDLKELRKVAGWSAVQRTAILNNRGPIESLHSKIGILTDLDEGSLTEILDTASGILESLSTPKALGEMPSELYRIIREYNSFEQLQAVIFRSGFAKAVSRFPELAEFDGEKLKLLLNELEELEKIEIETSATQVINQLAQKFSEADRLLRSEPTKLNAERKALRSKLKKGKSILVKEFAKSRSHPSVRELLSSEAREWIQLLFPVWMATPAQVADHFPLERNLFDKCLLDEASQMPLPDAYGSVFRSNTVVIAGDDKQMSPTSYFGKSAKWHDVFHQASFNLPVVSLNHHYRSAQPELIAFSNRYFYNSSLITFPPAKREQAVFLHRVGGIYNERSNPEEADAVVKWLENFDWKSSLGLVAFSEEQLKCILSKCSPKLLDKLENGRENGTVFIKSLEQVQGDEADVVAISLGYGKNAEGKFRLQFGPVNQSNGYKRLNVLFSRARKALHFFSSVSAADFPLSDNEGVDLLRKYLEFAENNTATGDLQLPFGISGKISDKTLTVSQITDFTQNAREILTFHEVMKSLGWEVKYGL